MILIEGYNINHIIKNVSLIKNQSVEEKYNFLETLQRDQPDAELTLVLLTDDRLWNIRSKALELLSNFGGSLALLAVKAALNDVNWLVRIAAIDALGKIGKINDARWLYNLLQDNVWQVRAAAVISLEKILGSKAKKILQQKYHNETQEIVRRDIVYALLDIKNSIGFFQDAIQTETSKIVFVAIVWALYVLGEKNKIVDIVSFLESKNQNVRANTIQAIEPELLISEHTYLIVNAINLMIEGEENPGIKADAVNLLKELKRA